jgi:hypothetical protein
MDMGREALEASLENFLAAFSSQVAVGRVDLEAGIPTTGRASLSPVCVGDF